MTTTLSNPLYPERKINHNRIFNSNPRGDKSSTLSRLGTETLKHAEKLRAQ